MTDKTTVVPATEADLPYIKPLLMELLSAVEDKEGLDEDRAIENCRALLNDPAHFMLVAKDAGGVVGFINFMTRQSVMHSRPSGLIDELVVSQKARSHGEGKLLVQAAALKCRELDCCELEVSTEKSNAAARRFYKASGFDEDAVLLEMDL
jgi:ribosomal protein S18 acetylase RimI-like enzyme